MAIRLAEYLCCEGPGGGGGWPIRWGRGVCGAECMFGIMKGPGDVVSSEKGEDGVYIAPNICSAS